MSQYTKSDYVSSIEAYGYCVLTHESLAPSGGTFYEQDGEYVTFHYPQGDDSLLLANMELFLSKLDAGILPRGTFYSSDLPMFLKPQAS